MRASALGGYGSRACFSGAPVHPFGWQSERRSSCMPSAACSMCSALLGGDLGPHRRTTSRSPRRTSSCSGTNSCEGASDRADSRSLATRNEPACIDVPLCLRVSIYLILGHARLKTLKHSKFNSNVTKRSNFRIRDFDAVCIKPRRRSPSLRRAIRTSAARTCCSLQRAEPSGRGAGRRRRSSGTRPIGWPRPRASRTPT